MKHFFASAFVTIMLISLNETPLLEHSEERTVWLLGITAMLGIVTFIAAVIDAVRNTCFDCGSCGGLSSCDDRCRLCLTTRLSGQHSGHPSLLPRKSRLPQKSGGQAIR